MASTMRFLPLVEMTLGNNMPDYSSYFTGTPNTTGRYLCFTVRIWMTSTKNAKAMEK